MREARVWEKVRVDDEVELRLQKASDKAQREEKRLQRQVGREEKRQEQERLKMEREKEKAEKAAERECLKQRDAEKALQLSQKGRRTASQTVSLKEQASETLSWSCSCSPKRCSLSIPSNKGDVRWAQRQPPKEIQIVQIDRKALFTEPLQKLVIIHLAIARVVAASSFR